ncbi:hypothetical protein RclHR1_08750002 [Rhizophagus clarus]|uniref:Uncharacterized protein n=1 Tax=Rhizophagus clarus TaxID=94130 RepID=A0A2Z6S8A4_9GLOM|nr:hypothetical protein RclHR1_08750002 [Rhizophagus clarus]GES79390.1 hypothetical protein RCL_jg6388.t1 [Rhizophagus clarus]
MADNTDSTIAMTAGSRSAALIDEDIACAVPELTSGNCSCVNQRVALKEKIEKYYEYYETFKGKIVSFVKEGISRQSIAKDESKEVLDVISPKKNP